MNTTLQTGETKTGGFDRNQYNRQYYLRNKEKLCDRRTERYRICEGAKALNEYVNTDLDKDLVTFRDELLRIDETDPEQLQRCIDLMKVAKMSMEIKCIAAGLPQEEIDRIHNLPII